VDLSSNEYGVLKAVREGETEPNKIASKLESSAQEVMSAASWLRTKGLVDFEESVTEFVSLNEEGKKYAKIGLPERRVVEWLSENETITLSEIVEVGLSESEGKIAVGWLKRKGFATIEKGKSGPKISYAGNKGETTDEPVLMKILFEEEIKADDLEKEGFELLKGRKILEKREEIDRKIILTEEGKNIDLGEAPTIGEITPEMIQSGDWKDKDFQKYSLNTKTTRAQHATLHPFTRFIEEIRLIFLQMGFQEIEGDYVQSAFWNMDALFIPQDHPARELQDTLYLDNSESFDLEDKELVKKIKDIHENGGDTESTGWGGKWDVEKAKKALLRTHTTVNTIKYLAENPKPPARVFGVGRVFRYESVDSTHLPEFTQVEGIIMEKDASFAMLIGVLKEFYKRMGFSEVRVRPAYFPYTEPSLEIEVVFNGKWLELGGAGVFRPEVTAPFGIEYPVLAWGLGLERLAMLKLGLKDIRMLFQSDLDWLKETV
tara:strand:+ start:849 stop:2315 length:1467 start_codon:yes stop_codon:yes gene_type:complete